MTTGGITFNLASITPNHGGHSPGEPVGIKLMRW